MVGNKFLHDDGEDDEVISSEWAASGDIDLKQLNKLELEFLDAIVSTYRSLRIARCLYFRIQTLQFTLQDWNIFVNEESFEAGLSRLERQVALKQARARGFFTYTDLAAACDGAALGRALAAACLALSAGAAALLASALLAAQAWRLLALTSRGTELSAPALDPIVSPAAPLAFTFANNATVELTIDALAAEPEAAQRLECCAAWRRQRERATWARRGEVERLDPWSRTTALGWLPWSALVSPVQRWLGRVAEYAELSRTAVMDAAAASHDDGGEAAPHCVRQWLNLSKLGALLVTVSDR